MSENTKETITAARGGGNLLLTDEVTGAELVIRLDGVSNISKRLVREVLSLEARERLMEKTIIVYDGEEITIRTRKGYIRFNPRNMTSEALEIVRDAMRRSD